MNKLRTADIEDYFRLLLSQSIKSIHVEVGAKYCEGEYVVEATFGIAPEIIDVWKIVEGSGSVTQFKVNNYDGARSLMISGSLQGESISLHISLLSLE